MVSLSPASIPSSPSLSIRSPFFIHENLIEFLREHLPCKSSSDDESCLVQKYTPLLPSGSAIADRWIKEQILYIAEGITNSQIKEVETTLNGETLVSLIGFDNTFALLCRGYQLASQLSELGEQDEQQQSKLALELFEQALTSLILRYPLPYATINTKKMFQFKLNAEHLRNIETHVYLPSILQRLTNFTLKVFKKENKKEAPLVQPRPFRSIKGSVTLLESKAADQHAAAVYPEFVPPPETLFRRISEHDEEFEDVEVSTIPDSDAVMSDIIPSQIMRIHAACHTAKNLLQGFLANPQEVIHRLPVYDPQRQGRQRLDNPGAQLTNIDIKLFIAGLKQKTPLNVLYDFLDNISALDFEIIKESINTAGMNFISGVPICIPVVFEKQEAINSPKGSFLSNFVHRMQNVAENFERKHIVLIFIKNETVFYYDSKGRPSRSIPLKNASHTLRSVLEYCKERFNAHKIKAVCAKLQIDANNCGAHVCRYLYFETSDADENLLHVSINEFRQKIKTIAYGNSL